MIAVRLATLADAGAIERQTSSIEQLHNKALPMIFKPPSANLFPPETLAARIRDPFSIVAVAEIGGKVVGHIYGEVVTRPENAFQQADSYLYIHQIGVDADTRRQGAGTALIAFAREWARSFGVAAVELDHWAFNAGAREFFEACGFWPVKVTMRQPIQDDTSP
jgi:GNAT superfamily N-acetyltransferase